MKNIKHIASLIIFSILLSTIGYGYSTPPTEPLVEVLKTIQDEYKVIISYDTKDVADVEVYFGLREQEDFEAAMNRALISTGLSYKCLGLNFYILYKDNEVNQLKLEEISQKIEQIKQIGNEDDIMISEDAYNYNLYKESITQVHGKITDQKGIPLLGATVTIKGTTIGTLSDVNGNFSFKLPIDTDTLLISHTGYDPLRLKFEAHNLVNVMMKEGLTLSQITVLGSRTDSRTSFDSAVPIDHISIDALDNSTGTTLDEKLNMLIPSFNSGQHPVSDASAHFNPVGLRGLLPSRTLILINGKRKNNSALLYTYVTASRGEVGVDLNTISSESIESVEILRDGASAQYGSDAVAGAINFVIKKKIKPFIKSNQSITGQLDGLRWHNSAGYSFNINEKGFATVILNYSNQKRTQRAGKIHSAEAEYRYWEGSNFSLEDFDNYLENNPSAGFQVGLPDIESLVLSYNSEYELNSKGSKIYAFGSSMRRSGSSPQFARGPYWVSGFESIYPEQDFFLPEMAPVINDHSYSAGIEHQHKEWTLDVSTTYGRNQIDYYINNSFNQSLGANSPKDFFNGSHIFRHWVNNIDAKRKINGTNLESLTLAIGLEHRLEYFGSEVGEFASYGDGSPTVLDRIGSESFSGLSPDDVVSGRRNNLGLYSELTADITDKMQLAGAVRFENYSDFGTNISWKLNYLYKIIGNKLNIRGSISNGFRAPSLHQIHYTSTTTTLTTSGIEQNRILNNLDPALAVLQIPRLMPETSMNMGAGIAYRLNRNMAFTVDLYEIDVADRIVLSGQIGRTETEGTAINRLLEQTNTGTAGFFLNAVDTRSRGIDIVFNFDHISLFSGQLYGNVAANFNKTRVTNINLPQSVDDVNITNSIFSREDISRLESWRPQQKGILSISYKKNKLTNTVSLNYIGHVDYKHSVDPTNDARYRGKTLTNWNISYHWSKHLNITAGINNIFNIYPDTFLEAHNGSPKDPNIDFVGRFKYPWQTIQFGIDGIRFLTKVTFTL